MTSILSALYTVLPAAETAGGPAPVQEATGPAAFASLLVIIPLAVAVFLLIAGNRTNRWGHWLAVAASWASFILGFAILLQLLGLPASERRFTQNLFTWIPAGDFQVSIGFLIDPLSMTFVMLVTLVGSLILVYSVGYMEDDPARRRFFAYLALFIASMLMLVLANNYTAMFLGWEGVGLSSYLLIGFWNQISPNASAANKAFIMNRVGDAAFLVAMMAMVAAFNSTDFSAVNEGVAITGQGTATVIGVFLLIAACAKSAQFPLQAWLLDAMAGPTPVSALIHAATMVTAGVYLIVRSGVIFVFAPVAMALVAVVGVITLLLGALIGSFKDDIKKALAASTMSQVGYMMLGAGLGPIGWAFAIFHLFAHGFFKALLFLGAGSVMHGMSDEVNMRRFGALRKFMVVTWATFMMGWLAIIGIPPFSGFWSKDHIIEAAFATSTFAGIDAPWAPWVFGWITVIGAGLTGFYMSRMFFMTYYGKARWEELGVKPHDPKPVMTVPMIILAIFAAVLGGVLSINDMFTTWLTPAIGPVEHSEPVMSVIAIQVVTLALVLIATFVAWRMYAKDSVSDTVPYGNAFVRAARSDFYQDEINEVIAVAPTMAAVEGVTAADKYGIDGSVNGLARLNIWLGKVLAWTETGYLRSYAGYMLGGIVVILAIVLGFRL